jgi:excisionase family DNA binding protein
MSELLTRPEAARELRVSITTLKRWLAAGALVEVELGPRTRRIERSELARFVAGRRRRPTPTVKGSPGRRLSEGARLWD